MTPIPPCWTSGIATPFKTEGWRFCRSHACISNFASVACVIFPTWIGKLSQSKVRVRRRWWRALFTDRRIAVKTISFWADTGPWLYRRFPTPGKHFPIDRNTAGSVQTRVNLRGSSGFGPAVDPIHGLPVAGVKTLSRGYLPTLQQAINLDQNGTVQSQHYQTRQLLRGDWGCLAKV